MKAMFAKELKESANVYLTELEQELESHQESLNNLEKVMADFKKLEALFK